MQEGSLILHKRWRKTSRFTVERYKLTYTVKPF